MVTINKKYVPLISKIDSLAECANPVYSKETKVSSIEIDNALAKAEEEMKIRILKNKK